MLSVTVKEWKFCCIQFSFVFFSQKLTHFCVFNFLGFCRAAKEKIYFPVFLQVKHIKLSSSCWYFLIFWPFIYWTLNKRCLETWSCLCGYCAYGLFWALVLALKSEKSPGNLGVCRVQFHSGVNGLTVRYNLMPHRVYIKDIESSRNVSVITSVKKKHFIQAHGQKYI